MSKYHSLLGVSVLAMVLGGCLKTRGDMKETEEKQVLHQQVVSLQKETADSSSRFGEVNEQIRDLRGRVEVVEDKIGAGNTEAEKARKALNEHNQDSVRKIALLQETITKLDSQVQSLSGEVQTLRAELATHIATSEKAAAAAAAPAASGKKDSFETGLDRFQAKDWKKAILSFQKYRDANPKGKKSPEAAYLMGVCFQELGMKDEAKTFYEEVIAKYSSSPEAKKSKTRLKSLKK